MIMFDKIVTLFKTIALKHKGMIAVVISITGHFSSMRLKLIPFVQYTLSTSVIVKLEREIVGVRQ